jgi:protein-L-isoaspartate(D-aspartate) O-methyltransferase
MDDDHEAEAREEMVQSQLVRRGVCDPRVLDAMRQVPRASFVPPEHRHRAHEDAALPAGEGQTISQPYMVARMIEALELEGGERVLEIGTGTGYSASVMSHLAGEVVTIERNATLVAAARDRLERLGYSGRIEVRHGDGTRGCPERAPFDAIVVAAGGPEIPQSLLDQLLPGGRLVMPVGTRTTQRLVRMRRDADGALHQELLEEAVFVPLIGAEAWEE